MIRAGEDICARCAKLTTQGYPEQMAVGKGRCTGYDNTLTPLIDPFVAWNTKSCVHFARVWNSEPREQWIKKQEAKTQQPAQPETKG